jgi:hypothetical protein
MAPLLAPLALVPAVLQIHGPDLAAAQNTAAFFQRRPGTAQGIAAPEVATNKLAAPARQTHRSAAAEMAFPLIPGQHDVSVVAKHHYPEVRQPHATRYRE